MWHRKSTKANKRKLLCKNYNVEEFSITSWEWFQKMKQKGVRITGHIVQVRALRYAKELQIPGSEFKAFKDSFSRLSRFRDRHNSPFVTNVKTVEDWKVKSIDMI